MNREDIIRMAREAECSETWGMDAFQFTVEELERFAALVAYAEREKCAKVLDDWKKHNWTFDDCSAAIRARGKE